MWLLTNMSMFLLLDQFWNTIPSSTINAKLNESVVLLPLCAIISTAYVFCLSHDLLSNGLRSEITDTCFILGPILDYFVVSIRIWNSFVHSDLALPFV